MQEDKELDALNLKARLTAMTKWLEAKQPDVFQRGLWDAINEADKIAPQPSPAVDLSGLTRAYNSGYKAGHHDTVEAQYTDIAQRDMYTYHSDVVAELVADGTISTVPVVPVGGLTDERIDQIARKHNLDGSMLIGPRSDYWRAFARHIERELLATNSAEPTKAEGGEAPDQVKVPDGWQEGTLARRWCSGDQAWSQWALVSASGYAMYRNDPSFQFDANCTVESIAAAPVPPVPAQAQAWNGELPEPRAIRAGHSFPKVYAMGYTADQMREAIGAAVEAAARAVRERAVSDEIFVDTAVETILASQESVAADTGASVPQGWISVDERLPEVGELVMVYSPPTKYDHPGEVNIGFDCIDPDADEPTSWLNHNEHYEHYCCVAKPEGSVGPSAEAPYTYWMPLPAAPAPSIEQEKGDSQ